MIAEDKQELLDAGKIPLVMEEWTLLFRDANGKRSEHSVLILRYDQHGLDLCIASSGRPVYARVTWDWFYRINEVR